jgi:hypothetical protein
MGASTSSAHAEQFGVVPSMTTVSRGVAANASAGSSDRSEHASAATSDTMSIAAPFAVARSLASSNPRPRLHHWVNRTVFICVEPLSATVGLTAPSASLRRRGHVCNFGPLDVTFTSCAKQDDVCE